MLTGATLQVQGADGTPAEVIARLERDLQAVVFGVNSLWAGVDVPGDALSQVIVLLDNRVIGKGHGRRILNSPPPVPVHRERIIRLAEEFLAPTAPAQS